MFLYFNRGTESETSVVVNDFYENLTKAETMMTATNSIMVDQSSIFPSYEDINGLEFNSLEVETDTGVLVPLSGHYREVKSISISYNDASKMYTVNISIR